MQCPQCGKELKSETGLKMHLKVHEAAISHGAAATPSAVAPSNPSNGGLEAETTEVATTVGVEMTEAEFSKIAERVVTKVDDRVVKDDRVEALLKEVAELKRKDGENQKTLQMLYEVADKGRIFNWEAQRQKDKKPQKVKLSLFRNGIIVGWRTIKDELIQDPRTGRTVGESQEYEVLVQDAGGLIRPERISGYLNFSNARYDERIECEVLSKSEGFDGKVTFEVGLLDGRRIKLDSRFVN